MDGWLGTLDHADGRWQGYQATALDATVDLGEARAIKTIRCRFLEAQPSWIFLPTRVEGVCNDCGGSDLVRRADDQAKTVMARLDHYHAETAPLIATLLERHGAPDHPMTQVLRDGLAGYGKPARRGGWRGRRS